MHASLGEMLCTVSPVQKGPDILKRPAIFGGLISLSSWFLQSETNGLRKGPPRRQRVSPGEAFHSQNAA